MERFRSFLSKGSKTTNALRKALNGKIGPNEKTIPHPVKTTTIIKDGTLKIRISDDPRRTVPKSVPKPTIVDMTLAINERIIFTCEFIVIFVPGGDNHIIIRYFCSDIKSN